MWKWTLAIASGLLMAGVGSAIAQTPLAICQMPMKRGAEGIAACTAAIESGKHTGWDLAIAYGQRGIYYRETGDCARAIPDFDKALAAQPSPENFIPYYHKGLCLVAAGRRDEAIAAFRRLLAVSRGHAGSLKELEKLGVAPTEAEKPKGPSGGGGGCPIGLCIQ